MEVSVVISYYNNIPALELILMALNKQVPKNKFEVIVSEDGNAVQTVQFINATRPKLNFLLKHISQEDNGFRKCRALNNALRGAQSDFIIFIDGDCIPHKYFIKEYLEEKKEGRILFGRRVMLSDKFSKQLLQTKNLAQLNLPHLLLTGCKRIEEGLYLPFMTKYLKEKKESILLGCNMGIFKKDLVAINGFDEDYESPSVGEDTDIEWRLKAIGGLTFYSMKFKAIVYHLYHEVRFFIDDIIHNGAISENKKKQGVFICKNGLEKLP